MEDTKIVDLYFARDERAISETSDKYGALCFCVANNVLNDRENANECVNDTYLGVWNAIPPTRPNCFKAFVLKICRRLSIKRLRYETAQKRASGAVVPLSELEEVLPANGADPAEVSVNSIAACVSSFLRSEKKGSRDMFVRRYFFFDPISEIADQFGINENTVKSTLRRMRVRLKRHLDKEGFHGA